jgi:hypothetical protein
MPTSSTSGTSPGATRPRRRPPRTPMHASAVRLLRAGETVLPDRHSKTQGLLGPSRGVVVASGRLGAPCRSREARAEMHRDAGKVSREWRARPALAYIASEKPPAGPLENNVQCWRTSRPIRTSTPCAARGAAIARGARMEIPAPTRSSWIGCTFCCVEASVGTLPYFRPLIAREG